MSYPCTNHLEGGCCCKGTPSGSQIAGASGMFAKGYTGGEEIILDTATIKEAHRALDAMIVYGN